MNWRPEGWKNPWTYQVDEEEAGDYYMVLQRRDAYEAGADAMLEALKKTGAYYNDVDAPYKTVGVLKEIEEPGTLVFIPDKEV